MSSFHEKLSILRRERGINQKTAAAALGISQALLSHYENGAREPGLAFVCRACDYYSVSADYLLCRTERRDAVRELEQSMRGSIEDIKKQLDEAARRLDCAVCSSTEEVIEND